VASRPQKTIKNPEIVWRRNRLKKLSLIPRHVYMNIDKKPPIIVQPEKIAEFK
jgi:hypothetical protein